MENTDFRSTWCKKFNLWHASCFSEGTFLSFRPIFPDKWIDWHYITYLPWYVSRVLTNLFEGSDSRTCTKWRPKIAGTRDDNILWIHVCCYAVSLYFSIRSKKLYASIVTVSRYFQGILPRRLVFDVSKQTEDIFPSASAICKPCFRWLHHCKVRLSRAQTKERLLSDSYGQALTDHSCLTKVGLMNVVHY